VLSSRHYKFGRLSINKTRPRLMNQNWECVGLNPKLGIINGCK
jgi:hypothetical protein